MTRQGRGVWLLFLASALVLAPGSRSDAQYFGQNRVQYRTFDMRVLKTETFDIYYYPEEEESIKVVARMAERWNARLSRLLDFKFPDRQPLIMYASQPDFQQTNTLGGQEPGEGTGGVTESFKRRVILPFAGSLGETDHVLGHELVHAFQYAMSSRKATGSIEGPAVERMPLWFIEGMAEYLSVGSVDPHTSMWMRDAVARNKLPRIRDLEKSKYFPYRWGQALWAYIAGRWGDPVIGRILHAASRGGDAKGAIERILGVKLDTLSKEWQDALRQAYQPQIERTRAAELKPLLGAAGRGRMNLSPAVSPDGQQVVFLSEKSLFSVELYLADTRSGEVRKRISNAAANPRVDSLMFIYSAGAWDSSGRRFAHAVVERSRPTLVVRDVLRNRVELEIPLPQLGEVYNPTWSPDGQRIAFSALAGGVTDLFVYDLAKKQVTRLTDDPYADLQPAWSPDGKTIAFATDRFTSKLDDLRFGEYRLALIDPDSKVITPLPTFKSAKNINPQWSQDGASLYFISDRDGVSNVYRIERASGQLYQVTNLTTGVSGLTPLSPALSSASAASRLTFTSFQDDRYALYTLDDAKTLTGRPITGDGAGAVAAQLPPEERSYDQVVAMKHDANYGLPAPGQFRLAPYRPKLALDYITQPYISAGLDRFGSFVGGGTSLAFSDMLGDHNLVLTFQVNGGISDIAALAQYVNLRSRLNWGLFGGQVPYISYLRSAAIVNGNYAEIDYIYREVNRQIGAMATYPFNRAKRIEAMAGYRRVSFEEEVDTTTLDGFGNVIDYQEEKTSPFPALNLGEGNVALVHDTSVVGPTSPLLGSAYRLEAGAVAGSLNYRTLLGDVRKYVMPVRPFTLAGRVLFYGRLGKGATDERLNPLYLGYPGLVRGYDSGSFTDDEYELGPGGYQIPIYDRIVGSRLLVANLELRFPLLGLFGGNSYFGPFPVEAALFADGGTAWNEGNPPRLFGKGRESIWSVGAALRVNVFGIAVVEVDYVKPLDRPKKGAHWQFSFMPGF